MLDHPLSEAERVNAVRQSYPATAGLAGEPELVESILKLALPGRGVPVRIYDPICIAGSVPLLLWFHGGGFVSGDLETHDRPLRALRTGFIS